MDPSLIARGRATANSLMTLTLAAYSPNGTTEDANGMQIPAYASEGSTPGRFQSGARTGGDTPTRYITIGGVSRPVLEIGLGIPITAPVPVASDQRGVGWEYLVEAIGPSDDPALLGLRFLVVGIGKKSHATTRRLDVVEV